MEWRGRRQSRNVEDARGRRVAGGGGRSPLGPLIGFVFRTFGVKGVLALCAVGFVGSQFGLLDLSSLLGGGTGTAAVSPSQSTPEEDARFQFVSVVHDAKKKIWTREFQNVI